MNTEPVAAGQPTMNRWVVVSGGILIQLALGAIYAWSLFTPWLHPNKLFETQTIHVEALSGGRVSDELRRQITTAIEKYNQGKHPNLHLEPVGTELKVETVREGNWRVRDVEREEVYLVEKPQGKDVLVVSRRGHYGFTAGQTQWIFSAGLATFALVMLYAGRWQAKVGPRKVAVAGGIVLGGGYVLGGLLGDRFLTQLICIGLVGGAGIGLAYVIPIAVGVKWFPDKKGLITGLAVAGFGFGATIWVKLGDSWVWQNGLIGAAHGLFGLPHVQAVFIIYGLAFAALVLLGSVVMVNPPEGWKPAGWELKTTAGTAKTAPVTDLMPAAMARTPQYWGLLLMFTGSAMAGLMVIGCIKLFGIDSLRANIAGMTETQASAVAGTAMAFLAILNGLGRIIWGTVSDRIGRKRALLLMCLIQGVVMLVFFRLGATKTGLIVGACAIGFNFGGNFALFPAATADFFGNKNVGRNYPFVFLAYGIAGIAGPQIAGHFKDFAIDVNAWRTPFFIAGIACLVAACVGLTLKPPKQPEAASTSG